MKSNALRQAARGQGCAFQIVSVCNGNPETTVLCHLPDESHGMGLKSSDLGSAAFGCSSCHDVVDGRKCSLEYEENRWFYNYRAMVRTLAKWFELGLIKIK